MSGIVKESGAQVADHSVRLTEYRTEGIITGLNVVFNGVNIGTITNAGTITGSIDGISNNPLGSIGAIVQCCLRWRS
ncbi:hypothetical protein [Paraburkholderia sp. 35.1]|uniref:hypothetical protein n=1 Tax=Paraburkholderia sp. 35.1 TaxID=2991058 RepID=UPI003D247E4A